MSHDLHALDESEPVEPFKEGRPPESVADLLKADFAELSQNEEVFIPVQGYERTGLAVKYRLPESGKALDQVGRKVLREFRDNYSRNLYSAIDTMIFLCHGLYVKPPDVAEYVELDPDNTGVPIGFDDKLAELLGAPEILAARNVVKKLFGGNEMAIIAHAEKLSRWMQNTNADLSLEYWQQNLGE